MENYVKNTLQVNEEILFEPKLHWAVYFDTYFNAAFLYIVFCQFINGYIAHAHFFIHFFEVSLKFIAVIFALRLIYQFFRNYSVQMAVTNYRVVYKIGLIRIQTEELSIDKIESVSVHQSLLGRILNYGDINFSGTGTSKVIFTKIYAPWWVKSQIEDIISQSIAQRRESNYAYNNRNYYQAPQGYPTPNMGNPYPNMPYRQEQSPYPYPNRDNGFGNNNYPPEPAQYPNPEMNNGYNDNDFPPEPLPYPDPNQRPKY